MSLRTTPSHDDNDVKLRLKVTSLGGENTQGKNIHFVPFVNSHEPWTLGVISHGRQIYLTVSFCSGTDEIRWTVPLLQCPGHPLTRIHIGVCDPLPPLGKRGWNKVTKLGSPLSQLGPNCDTSKFLSLDVILLLKLI